MYVITTNHDPRVIVWAPSIQIEIRINLPREIKFTRNYLLLSPFAIARSAFLVFHCSMHLIGSIWPSQIVLLSFFDCGVVMSSWNSQRVIMHSIKIVKSGSACSSILEHVKCYIKLQFWSELIQIVPSVFAKYMLWSVHHCPI